jgi:hypothetical protein
MPRLYPVAGTKERYFGRQALTFRFANHGPVIVDGIRPEDCDEMFARLWGAYGKGSVWVTYRRMKQGEQYVEMPEVLEVAR